MAVSEKLQNYLRTSKVKFAAAKHPVVYTAQEIAAAQHVPGRRLAKSVLVKTERGALLAVLPAVQLIDLKRLKALLKAKTLAIAKEPEIREQFPDVEVGAMSPFGNLYNVPVVVDRSLGESDTIVFNAGSHTETITMRYQDFAALVKPKAGSFGQPIGARAAKKRGKPERKSKRPSRKTSARSRSKTSSYRKNKRRR